MPATFIAEQIAQVVMAYTINGNRLTCAFGYGMSTAVTQPKLVDLLGAVDANVVVAFLNAASEEMEIESLYGYCILKETCNQASRHYAPNTGGIAQQSLPSNVAVVIKKVQFVGPSRHNGRSFFSGVPETHVTDGKLNNAAATTEWLALADSIKLVLTGGIEPYVPVVIQRFDNNAAVAPVGWQIEETDVVVEIATQRRRTTELRGVST